MEETLIELVRLHEVIYDHSSSMYRDQNVRQQAWEEIATQLKITADNAKTKWERLRRCFCNARNRRLSTKSGQATKKILLWKFEAQMQFLLPYLEGRRTHGNLQDSKKKQESQVLPEEPNKDNDVDEQEMQDPDEVAEGTVEVEHNTSVPQQTPSQDLIMHAEKTKTLEDIKKNKNYLKKKTTAVDRMAAIMEQNAALRKRKFEAKTMQRNSNPFENLDETDIFFLGLARMMKMLPKVEQASVKLTVSNAILQAELRSAQRQRAPTIIPYTLQPLISTQDTSRPSTPSSAYYSFPAYNDPTSPEIVQEGCRQSSVEMTSILDFDGNLP